VKARIRAEQLRPNVNAKWHKKHKMPKNPSAKQRIKWHLAHAKHCDSRPIPEKLLTLIEKGGF
jgi:hypothetical protein